LSKTEWNCRDALDNPWAEALLALRAVNENGDWDDFHAFRRAKSSRLFGTPLKLGRLDLVERLDPNQF